MLLVETSYAKNRNKLIEWKAFVDAVGIKGADLKNNSSIRSDEGLTLETSAFQSLYGGQFTLSTPLINQIFV